MKKILTILGCVFAAIVVLLIIGAIIFIPRTLKLDQEAAAYIVDNLPPIVDHWNAQNLLDRASPELISATKSREELDRLFAMFQQLGSVRHVDTPQGSVYSGAFVNKGTYTIGNYTVHADFEKGPATISIQLLHVGAAWKVNGFHINSTLFLPPKA